MQTMKGNRITKILTNLFSGIIVILSLVSCTNDVNYSKLSAEEIYNIAEKEFKDEHYSTAAEAYSNIDLNYPYSSLANIGLLKGAFAYYKDDKYNEALDLIDKFLRLNMNSPDISYAYYLQVQCFLKQMSDYRRDQTATVDALKSIEYLKQNYPESKYTKELLPNIELLNNQLASKELEVGKGEQRIDNFAAAINSFQTVIKDYPQSALVPEAFYRLVEIYTSLALPDIRDIVYKQLSDTYPDSIWKTRADNIISKYH